MKINFLLPTYIRVPVGGFIVAFEYANRLALDGNEVNIISYRVRTHKSTIGFKIFTLEDVQEKPF